MVRELRALCSVKLSQLAVCVFGAALLLGLSSPSGAQSYCEKWAAQSDKVPSDCVPKEVRYTQLYDRYGRPLREEQDKAVCKLEVVRYDCPNPGPGISSRMYMKYTPLAQAPSEDTYSITTEEDQPGRERLLGGVEETVSIQGRPLDWLPKAVKWVLDRTPDGERRLQEARAFTDEMRKAAERGLQETSKLSDELTPKTPLDVILLATGPYGVTRSVAGAGAKRLAATAVVRAAEKFGETPAGKALGSSIPTKVKQRPGMPHEGAPPSQPPIGEPPPKSAGGPPEGPGPSKPPTGEPPEARGPPPGAKTNPLRGSAVVQEAKNLAGKTIDLGGGRSVTLGDHVADGGYGTVYKIEGRPNELFKIIHKTGERGGGAAVKRQLAGRTLITAGPRPLPTPGVISSGLDPPYLIVENIYAGPWAAKGANAVGNGPLTKAERQAIKKLYDDLGNRGLVWVDGHRGNIFFFHDGEILKAGILDQDFIYPVRELTLDSVVPDTLFGTPALEPLIDAMNRGGVPARKLTDAAFESLFPPGS